MTAPVLTSSLDSLLMGTLLSDCPTHFPESFVGNEFQSSVLHESNKKIGASPDKIELNSLFSHLLELLPQGIVIISRSLKAVYWNQTATRICSGLLGTELSASDLPLPISEACHRLLRDKISETASLTMEYQPNEQQPLRITTRWLENAVIPGLMSDLYAATNGQFGKPNTVPAAAKASLPFMVVLLENCSQTAQVERQIQQKKYDLTDREAEIWMLLRQEYSYQEIAHMLQISLNTVKTHVKNVYAKRRSSQGKDKYWWVSH